MPDIAAADLNEIRVDFFIRLPLTTPHQLYKHIPPPAPDEPDMPDTLNPYEVAMVTQWLQDRNYENYYLTYPAYAKIVEWQQYYASIEYKAWVVANYLARKNQWRWTEVDSAILNYPAWSPTGKGDDTGESAPPQTIPKQEPA